MIFHCGLLNSQDINSEKDSINILNEIKLFILTSNDKSIGKGIYNIFVLKIHKWNSTQRNFLFTLSKISNEFELSLINANYFTKMESDYILISFDNKIKFNDISYLNSKELNEYNFIQIREKLFPEKKGGITGFSSGIIYYQNESSVKIKYFNNADEIPSEFDFYDSFPHQFKIDTIELRH